MSNTRGSIKDRAKLFGGTTTTGKAAPREQQDAIESMLSPCAAEPKRAVTGIKKLTDKVRGLELAVGQEDSMGSLDQSDDQVNVDPDNNNHNSKQNQSFDQLKYEHDKKQILVPRNGTVAQIATKFNEQIAQNVAAFERALEEKIARKKRYRNKVKKRTKYRPRKKKTQQHLLNDSVWSNQMSAPSFKVDPRTYTAPKRLTRPSVQQEKIIKQALADNVLIRDDPGPQLALLHAFEPIAIRKGQQLPSDDDDYFYVVEEGTVDIEQRGKVIATAHSGDTFGDMNLVYNRDIGRKHDGEIGNGQTLVAKDDVKLLRLKQEDFRGIVQSQAKQEDIDKQEMLKNLPFVSKLVNARNSDVNKEKKSSDAVERITAVMKPFYFKAGDQLYNEDDETLYIIKEGNVKLTSKQNQEFVLGPGDHIGRQALMGTRGKEPEVKSIVALTTGMAYTVAKSVAEKALGANYITRQTSRLDDSKKLDNFQCIKKINLDRHTLETIAETVDDKTFAAGSVLMKQGAQVEPCLYIIREGSVILSSDDGSFVREVGPGGYFGVEKLLVPKNATGENAKPSKDMTLPAQWNVTVGESGHCVMGVLSLVDSQEILDNDGKKTEKPLVEKPESKFVVKRKQTSKIVRKTVQLDDLEMVNVLGDGAFGEVWLVRADVDGTKEEFALKKIKKEPELIDSLHREVAFLTRFGIHPFIINLIKVFDRDDCMYMLLNLASGGELWDVVHREDVDGNWTSGIPEQQARFYTFLLADTLAFIHSKKFVYRDLKPENVLIDSDGYPILIDFGFTKHCPEKTYTCCGTPNYVAPEIVTNDGHNHAVDWWALGILLYEMVSGEHPFYVDGMDQMDLFESVALEDYTPIPCKASKGVEELVDGFLVKDPSQRLGNLAGRENDVLGHPYFEGLDLKTLRTRKIKAPWIPPPR